MTAASKWNETWCFVFPCSSLSLPPVKLGSDIPEVCVTTEMAAYPPWQWLKLAQVSFWLILVWSPRGGRHYWATAMRNNPSYFLPARQKQQKSQKIFKVMKEWILRFEAKCQVARFKTWAIWLGWKGISMWWFRNVISLFKKLFHLSRCKESLMSRRCAKKKYTLNELLLFMLFSGVPKLVMKGLGSKWYLYS